MGGEEHSLKQPMPSEGLYRVLSTSITIYHAAITLLGEPPPEGVALLDFAQIACVKNILAFLTIDDDDTLPFS